MKGIKFYCTFATNQHTHTDKICSSYITIHRHISVASATVSRVPYKNTNTIKSSQNF